MTTGSEDHRSYWLATLQRIANPVLQALSQRRLKELMPIESRNSDDRHLFTHLEAIARLLAGIAPWLETPSLSPEEEQLRQHYANLSRQCIDAATDPNSPDYCNFTHSFQPIVDAAFLAHAILRAPTELWHKLPTHVQTNVSIALKQTRSRKPYFNNWLLFAATIETALYLIGEPDWDPMRIDYALKQHEQWYVGDGIYGDGPHYHADYYNSFVIQPMLIDILTAVGDHYPEWQTMRSRVLTRAQRYAAILERSISPEGTFPVLGRSLAYRFGTMQLLAQIAHRQELPTYITPAQVRSALTTIIRRMIEMPGTFDPNGWLTIGFCGRQPELGESYISTGSTYLCSTIFLPLGLPANNPFWSDPPAPWTSQKAWGGMPTPIDHAI